MSYFALPGILFSIPAGVLSDRYGARTVGLVSLLLMTVGSALTAAGGDFLWLAAGRTIAGSGRLYAHRYAYAAHLGLVQGQGAGLPWACTTPACPRHDHRFEYARGHRPGAGLASRLPPPLRSVCLLLLLFITWRAYRPGRTEEGRKRKEGKNFRPSSIVHPLSSLFPRPSVFRTLGPGVWLVGVSWLWVNAAGISFPHLRDGLFPLPRRAPRLPGSSRAFSWWGRSSSAPLPAS